jgi:hypothetical protein
MRVHPHSGRWEYQYWSEQLVPLTDGIFFSVSLQNCVPDVITTDLRRDITLFTEISEMETPLSTTTVLAPLTRRQHKHRDLKA